MINLVIFYIWTKIQSLYWWYVKDFLWIYDWAIYPSPPHDWIEDAPDQVLERASVRYCPYLRDRSARELAKRERMGTYRST